MTPFRFFLFLVFFGLIVLALWFWNNSRVDPVETDIVMDPREPIVEQKEDPAPIVEAPVIAEPAATTVDNPIDPTLGFEAADCRWLTRHIPDADVAYKPGVDVHGKPVVPADLNGTYELELPKTVIASVSRRLLKHPNLRQETPFAEIEIDLETGAIRINGKGLLSEDQERLIAYCKDQS